MSVLAEKHYLDRRNFKYLFLASYFNLNEYDAIAAEAKPFINYYLKNNFNNLDESCVLKYLDYLNGLNIKNIVMEKSINVLQYVKPQFKFYCNKNNLDILMFDDKVYLQPNTPIYATNLFVSNPKNFRVILYAEFAKVFNERNFVNNAETYCLMNGNMGYVFEDAYVDWCGVRLCHMPKITNSLYPYRLYLIGEPMAKHFIENNIDLANKQDYIYKNFHKGLPLFKNNFRIINSKKFVTKKPNKLFDEMRSELDTHSSYIKLIQRDYIYDADFSEELFELLNDYMSQTALFKFIVKFNDSDKNVFNKNSVYNEIVVDRYAVNRYRKLNIKIEPNTTFPLVLKDQPSFIMMRDDMIQIKGTLNAFYVPKVKLFAILSNNTLFGSTELLHFSPSLIQYSHNTPPKRLQNESYVIDKKQKLYLTKFIFGDSVPAYLLIRGDYESSFKSLKDFNNTWVQNTLLKLLITPDFVERSLELIDYNLRSNF
uniref:Early 49 kDa protein n=1 Tax=Ectropis obliqua nucleopolyhedrovirus TaxID=59376 RepID=S5TJ46_9ABAC|nr:putative 55.4 kDa protein [Ectropis obliqua nucleopolyhedrovirus]QWV59597.1 early 49 kDa protein [Ectropis obliqua nucleopolyhedrovirus]UYO72803.1 early 49 kDa protein [Ectropis obliqua nucleopolyhedrovirus]